MNLKRCDGDILLVVLLLFIIQSLQGLPKNVKDISQRSYIDIDATDPFKVPKTSHYIDAPIPDWDDSENKHEDKENDATVSIGDGKLEWPHEDHHHYHDESSQYDHTNNDHQSHDDHVNVNENDHTNNDHQSHDDHVNVNEYDHTNNDHQSHDDHVNVNEDVDDNPKYQDVPLHLSQEESPKEKSEHFNRDYKEYNEEEEPREKEGDDHYDQSLNTEREDNSRENIERDSNSRENDENESNSRGEDGPNDNGYEDHEDRQGEGRHYVPRDHPESTSQQDVDDSSKYRETDKQNRHESSGPPQSEYKHAS